MHNPVRFTDPTGLFAIVPGLVGNTSGNCGILELAQRMLQSIRNSAPTTPSSPTEATTTHSPAVTAPVSIQNIHFGVIAGGFDNKVRLRDGIGGPRKTQRVGGEGSRGGTPTTNKPPVTGQAIPSKATLTSSASTPGKGGVTPVGRAFAKHQARPKTAFTGTQSGNAAKNTQQGMAHLDKILNNPNSTFTVRNTKAHGDVLDVRMPCGKGARWTPDGTRFIGFLEP